MNEMTPQSAFDADRSYSVSDRLADILGFGHRAMAAKRLASMDDHMLRDIGVQRDDIGRVTGLDR